jgi:hypothetical protein
MVVIEFKSRMPAILITNDKTFTEVLIHARDYEHEKELAMEIIAELLKGE